MSSKLSDLDPDVMLLAEKLLSECFRRGLILKVTHTRRSFDEQQELFAQGRSKPGIRVTAAPAGYSWHNFGRAFDVAIVSYPQDRTPSDLYDGPWGVIGDLGEELGLEWGGRWKNPDKPHFQHTGGMTLAELRTKARQEGLLA